MNDPQARPAAKDVWDQGAAYERYMGRWSRPVAHQFVAWLNIAPGSCWLDVGCGTGVLSRAILERADPAQLTGIDASSAILDYARKQVSDERGVFLTGDARQLPVEDAGCDTAVAGLVLNFIPDKTTALREMRRAVKPGGVVAVYVWDYADRMQMHRLFWEEAAALQPDARQLDVGSRFPECKPGPLVNLFRGAGLHEIEVRPIEIDTRFQDFEDFWTPMLGGQGTAPGYVKTLDEDARGQLREALRKRLPTAPDGSIPLAARAWAVRGYR